MSDVRNLHPACSGKMRFASHGAALGALRRRRGRCRIRTRDGRRNLHAYRCRFCHGWHVGSDAL